MRIGDTADAVARLLPGLTPAALLLTDDPAHAVRLLGEALGTRRALDGPDAAMRALAGEVVRRPRWSAEGVIQADAPPPADEDAALAAALGALPGRDRAALV